MVYDALGKQGMISNLITNSIIVHRVDGASAAL